MATVQDPELRRALPSAFAITTNSASTISTVANDNHVSDVRSESHVSHESTCRNRERKCPQKIRCCRQAVAENLLPVLTPNPEQNVTDPVAALKLIREDLGDCTRCKLHKQGRKQIVFGVGNPHADLMFVGEGPGADEDAQGEPFVGRAGQLLNNMIKAMGIRREDVYIANIVKCRPPGNRTPERDECETCSPFLMRQIAAIKPKVIVALGAVSAKNLLAINAPMSELRGRFYDFMPTGARSSDPNLAGSQAGGHLPSRIPPPRSPSKRRSLERPADGHEVSRPEAPAKAARITERVRADAS